MNHFDEMQPKPARFMEGHDFRKVENVDRYVRHSLAGIGRTITKLIYENFQDLMAMETLPGMVLMMTKLLAAHDIDTPASRRLMNNIENAPSVDVIKGIICNSFLSGDGNGVICR